MLQKLKDLHEKSAVSVALIQEINRKLRHHEDVEYWKEQKAYEIKRYAEFLRQITEIHKIELL